LKTEIFNMSFENILVENEGGISRITINRPDKMNALNKGVLSELKVAIDSLLADDNLKGAILTGAGDKAFVAGADIAEFANYPYEQAKELSQFGHDLFDKIEQSPKPVLALINGYTLGGGCELAMACHMRIATETSKFGQPEVNLGLIPGYGGTQRLARYIGRPKATELLVTGDMIGAEEALQLGLINYVLPADEALEKANKIMGKVARKSTLAVGRMLNLVQDYYSKDKNGFANEVEEFGRSFETEDFKEGTTAFLEKRKPEFKGA